MPPLAGTLYGTIASAGGLLLQPGCAPNDFLARYYTPEDPVSYTVRIQKTGSFCLILTKSR
jgi:hypothetical protein